MRVNRSLLAVSLLVIASFMAIGCTVSDPNQDLLMDDSSAETDRLVAGIEALNPVDVQENAQQTATSLVFFIINETDTDQSVLVWNTPLENPLSADLFLVQRHGQALEYQGRLIKRGSPLPEHFQTISAGESIKAVVDLGNYYDMSASGTYDVQLVSSINKNLYQSGTHALINFLPDAVTISVP